MPKELILSTFPKYKLLDLCQKSCLHENGDQPLSYTEINVLVPSNKWIWYI